MSQHIIVTKHNEQWDNEFKSEAEKIKDILGENCVAIHHIGSTAVKGLSAKPIIDIMPVVKNLADVDILSAEFEKIGYEYMGEFGIIGRRYLRKGGDERTHQIHIFSETSQDEIKRHLAVRDYLRSCKEKRDEYSKLKTALAKKHPYDSDGYCDGKDVFMKQLESEAIEWRKMNGTNGMKNEED